PGRGRDILGGDGGLPGTGGAHQQHAGTAVDPTAQQAVQLGNVALHLFVLDGMPVLRRDQPGKNVETALANAEVVIPSAELLAPQFDDSQPAAGPAVLVGAVLQQDHTMNQGANLEVAIGVVVVEQQYGAVAADKELFQRQELA